MVLLFSIALLRPRQPCHGAQGMDFDGRSFRVGPDCARTSTTVGEVAPRKASGGGSAQNVPTGRWRSSHVHPGVSITRAPDPDAVQDAANQRVIKLEAALRAMGDYDGPEVATLKSSLQKARAASRSKPIPDQIAETATFISRAQKRLSALEEERVREQELLDKALVRQERLRRELESEREEQPCKIPNVSAQLHRLEATVELKKERDDLRQKVEGRRGVWMANEPPDVDRVPPIPSQEQHIYDWLSSRNCELRNALEFGDHRTVSKLSSLLAEGCGRLASFGATESMDTSSRSDLMTALITDGDAKRRCLLGKAALPSTVGNQVSSGSLVQFATSIWVMKSCSVVSSMI